MIKYKALLLYRPCMYAPSLSGGFVIYKILTDRQRFSISLPLSRLWDNIIKYKALLLDRPCMYASSLSGGFVIYKILTDRQRFSISLPLSRKVYVYYHLQNTDWQTEIFYFLPLSRKVYIYQINIVDLLSTKSGKTDNERVREKER